MRIYFLSCVRAALKLNGMFIGSVDGFERYIELDPADGIFAEIIPDENLQGMNFFIDDNFFHHPPENCDLYFFEGDALIYVRQYEPKSGKIEVLYQTEFCSNLITIFGQGGLYLSIDGREYSITPLPQSYRNFLSSVHKLGGREIFCVTDKKSAILVSEHGKIIYKNGANEMKFSDTLKVTADFETCTAARSECEYTYDGQNLTRISAKTIELRPPERDIVHFAFFESVLTGGDYTKYLDDSLIPLAKNLKSYLGDFVAVTVPTGKFYCLHGDIAAAGLVYPREKNIFDISYFSVQLVGEKIANIFPVE